MKRCLKLSLEYANQRSYLDDLFRVYPTIPNGIREIDIDKWRAVETSFETRDSTALLDALLQFELFPIKDSYVAYLREDRTALQRNPATVARLAGELYEMGLAKIFNNCSEPKETNRQLGPLFKNWVASGALGLMPVGVKQFMANDDNAILQGSDAVMKETARELCGYKREKGLDFVARFNSRYVIGEAKFLTDNGGHQNAQFNDAISTLRARGVNAVKVAILDGVLYIPGGNKIYKELTTTYADCNIMSALLLRNFLYTL